MLKICIATYEFEGIQKNGGIGTAYKNLALYLVSLGYDVTIFLTSAINFSDEQKKNTKKIFQDKGLNIAFPGQLPFSILPVLGAYCSLQAYSTFYFLKNSSFDIIHIPDSSGDAYYLVQAKLAGLYFQNTKLIIGAHGSSLWVRESNEERFFGKREFVLDHFEKSSLSDADIVVSPSKYYKQWMYLKDFNLPKSTYSVLNCPPQDFQSLSCDNKLRYPDKIVFFGRLEKRKGVDLFCAALNKIKNNLHMKKIIFLGKTTSNYSQENIKKLIPDLDISFISNYNSEQAIAYLKQNNVLAVMPSRSETMCYTVMECLVNGIPFIASNSGAIPELIHEKYHQYVLFECNVASLAYKIENILNNGIKQCPHLFNVDDILRKWASFHESVSNDLYKGDGTTSLLEIKDRDVIINGEVYAGLRDVPKKMLSKIIKIDSQFITICFDTVVPNYIKKIIVNHSYKSQRALFYRKRQFSPSPQYKHPLPLFFLYSTVAEPAYPRAF